ncbi:MAG: hypothetical protein WAM60_10940 [Candidatus Promineifilaceae bacterium]
MRRWTRRVGYLLVILLWLILVSFPVVAFLLATNGEIQVGDSSSGVRLFLLQDPDNQGLVFQWSRPYSRSGAADESVSECTRTTLRYLLWEGDASGQNTDYCQCLDPETGQTLPVGACTINGQ